MSFLPQQISRNQYIADGITTVYAYTFLILSASTLQNDIAVYVTPFVNGAYNPDPVTDIKVLGTDYTVQNVGNVNGGTVTFLPGRVPAITSLITLVRNMSVSIDTEFALVQNFNGANLDSAFERVVLIMQELFTALQFNTLTYIVNSLLPPQGMSNIVPVLPDNNVWIGQGGRVIAALIENNPDISTLRSQLASQVSGGGAGTSLIGYYDQNNNVPQTLNTFLNNLPAYITSLTSALKPGMMIDYAGLVAPTGFLVCDGSAVSRTTYAALYAAIGTQWGAGNGSTTFNVPDFRRRVAVGAGGSGTGTLGNAVANTGGTETEALTNPNQMPAHDHQPASVPVVGGAGMTFGTIAPGNGTGVAGSVTAITTSVGTSQPFNILQPSAIVNKIIKF